MDGFHAELEGKNGGGDPWHTYGRLTHRHLALNGEPAGRPDRPAECR
jgi:hypothetical protein